MTATGPISLAKQNLRNTIAGTATFQTLTGTASEAAALAHIYDEDLRKDFGQYTKAELVDLRPFAIVFSEESNGFQITRNARGVGSHFRDSGVVNFLIEVNFDDQRTYAENKSDFVNLLGALVTEMAELAGTAGYLDVNRMMLVYFNAADQKDAAQQGEHFYAMFKCEWGFS